MYQSGHYTALSYFRAFPLLMSDLDRFEMILRAEEDNEDQSVNGPE